MFQAPTLIMHHTVSFQTFPSQNVQCPCMNRKIHNSNNVTLLSLSFHDGVLSVHSLKLQVSFISPLLFFSYLPIWPELTLLELRQLACNFFGLMIIRRRLGEGKGSIGRYAYNMRNLFIRNETFLPYQ